MLNEHGDKIGAPDKTNIENAIAAVRAAILTDNVPELSEDLLARMDPEAADDVRALLKFPEHSAGRLMTDQFVRIAPAILPHISGRALTRKRYPDGVDKEPFFEKNAPMHKPDWVKTAPIWSEGGHRTVYYILANDLATLVWLASLAAIELHPSLAISKDIKCPTVMVYDLDPGPAANFVQCCQVAV